MRSAKEEREQKLERHRTIDSRDGRERERKRERKKEKMYTHTRERSHKRARDKY